MFSGNKSASNFARLALNAPRNSTDAAEVTAAEADKDPKDSDPETRRDTDNPDDNGVEDTGDVKGIGASLMSLASHRSKEKSDG